MSASPLTTEQLDRSVARLSGKIVLPEHGRYEEARLGWNLAVDQRPAAVAFPETAEDVVAIIDLARAFGLRVAPQGTGHNAKPLGNLEDTVLLKTERMRKVEIDSERRIARVEAGVLWLEVVEAAAAHGLATLAGSSPDVGVVGYTLGGGLSWLGRKHGLASNNVAAVELVTADGQLRRATRETEPDLFWAVRGGGGDFGVVTALEIELFPMTEVYAGVLWFPIERASEVLHTWAQLAETGLPDELTTVGRLLQLPPIEEIPEPVRGKSFVIVEAIHAGEPEVADRLLGPLRALGPVNDTIARIPMPALSHLHMDPEHPVSGVGDGVMLGRASARGGRRDHPRRRPGLRLAAPLGRGPPVGRRDRPPQAGSRSPRLDRRRLCPLRRRHRPHPRGREGSRRPRRDGEDRRRALDGPPHVPQLRRHEP